MLDITTGAFDYNTVIKKTIDEMVNSGLRTVNYDSGRTMRIESAVRNCLMTGVNQVTAKITEQNAEMLDTEYFEVSYHGGARPSHQEWQGKVYSKEELVSICGLGTVTGLCGVNCYHSYDPFISGISERTYTDEELARMNAEENIPKKYKGKEYTKYEALQEQRERLYIGKMCKTNFDIMKKEKTEFNAPQGSRRSKLRIVVETKDGKSGIIEESNKIIFKEAKTIDEAKL